MSAMRLCCSVLMIAALQTAGSATREQTPDVVAMLGEVREALRREYARPIRFSYVEQSREIDISKLGRVSIGSLHTYEVYPTSSGDRWKRLIAIDGKPLDANELAQKDAEHQRDVRKRQGETARQRAARQQEEAEEIRDRDAILDDAKAVYAPTFVCRETVDGQPMVVVSLKPRPEARVTTREGTWMKQTVGKLWISDTDRTIARLRLQTTDHLSIGWGVVARLEPGSGFDYVRTRVGDAWLPSALTMEGSGRTLLFRRFEVKSVTTYSDHKPYTP